MDMPITEINSDFLIDIEQPFRVSAGPGAGKTRWLVNHIKHVLHQSKRLGKTKKIACITYTNIAVETILERLDGSVDRVDVSTIHSFLYRHVLKPYISFIADEYDLNVRKIDGPEDHVVRRSNVVDWIRNHPNKAHLNHPFNENQLCRLENNIKALANWLATLTYTFTSDDVLEISSDRRKAYYSEAGSGGHRRQYLNGHCLDTLEEDFESYKKLYWKKGIIHHDDVLFFSYQLIQRFPFILQILSTKFPYFFVDEFQDTNPIQAKILEQIGHQGTIIGIIGDKAQSIYEFQGAVPAQFHSFTLPGMVDYEILDNWRSTNQIIDLLNFIRADIQQNKVKNEEGEKPIIIIHEMNRAYRIAQELCVDQIVYSLSRNNSTSNALKKNIERDFFSDDLLQSLYHTDSNPDRRGVIITCIKATELALQNRFKDALKEMERLFRDKADKKKKEALKHLILLLQNYNDFKELSLLNFHAFVRSKIRPTISTLNAGRIKVFYEANTYQQLAVDVKNEEHTGFHRTIHKAKGAEFDNVLLVLKEREDLNFLFDPDLEDEEQRINYVAISRAKKRLFISIPDGLSDEEKADLETLVDVI